MEKRICLMIDEDVDKKIRLKQAQFIQKNHKSYSYSKTLNLILENYLK